MPTDKPLLGLMPQYVWKLKVRRQRMSEILSTVDRYHEAERPIPVEWLNELQDLNQEEIPI